MKKYCIKICTLILVLFFIGNLPVFSQAMGIAQSDGSSSSWYGEIIIDGEEIDPISSSKRQYVVMNKNKNFFQIYYSFPNSPHIKKVDVVIITFHLEGTLDDNADKGKLVFDSYRNDPTNLSYYNFAGGYHSRYPIHPNQFSIMSQIDIKQGRYTKTYLFNAIDAKATLEIMRSQSENHYKYNLNLDIKLVKASPSDVGGERLASDLNAHHTIKFKGSGNFEIPYIARN